MATFRKSLRLSFLVCSIALCDLYSFKINAQGLQELNKAYYENSQSLLDQFVLEHKYISRINLQNDTVLQISALVNAFINNYCADTLSHLLPDAPPVPGHEKYIILQPRIETCFVDTLELSEILNPYSGRRAGITGSIYPHTNVYHSFLSANYYEFPNLLKCKKWSYIIDSKGKGRFILLKADTNMVHIVNAFLGKQGTENYSKQKFLKKALKIYPSGETQYILSINRRVRIYYFNYGLLIDRIVFNRSMDQALIQFSFVNQSLEAFYEKSGDKWIKKSYRIISQI